MTGHAIGSGGSGLPDVTGMNGRWLHVAGGAAVWDALPSLDLVPTAAADVDVGGNKVVNGAVGVASSDFAVVGQLPVAQAPSVALAPLRAKSDLSGWENAKLDGSGIANDVALAGNPTVATQSASDNSTRAASTAYVKAQGVRKTLIRGCNANITRVGDTGVAVNTALIPAFYIIDPVPGGQFTVSELAVRVTAFVASATYGVAIYSINVTGTNTFSASLVCMLNADVDAGANGYKIQPVTTGAYGSGAGTATLDFTTTYYLVGVTGSTTTTLKAAGNGLATASHSGIYLWTSAAFGTTHAWPGSFTNSDVATGATCIAVDMITADGALLK